MSAKTYFEWRHPRIASSSMCVIAARGSLKLIVPNLQQQLRSSFTQAAVTRKDDRVLALVWDAPGDLGHTVEAQLARLVSQFAVSFGVSNPFRDLVESRAYLDQAEAALVESPDIVATHLADITRSHLTHETENRKDVRGTDSTNSDDAHPKRRGADDELGGTTFFREVALSYLASSRDRELKRRALHPAVAQLDEIDRTNDSCLAETLVEYLICERSIKRTADRLFVHRNTVLYRINQIEEQCDVNLDDDYERGYLLFSLLFDWSVQASGSPD